MKLTPPSLQHFHHIETVNFDLFSTRTEAESKLYQARSAAACLLCAYRNVLLLYSAGCNFDYHYSLYHDKVMHTGEDRFFVTDVLSITVLGGTTYLGTRIGRRITHDILLNDFKLGAMTVLNFMNSCHFSTAVKEYTESRYWLYTDHFNVPFQAAQIKQYKATLKHLLRNEYDTIIKEEQTEFFTQQ